MRLSCSYDELMSNIADIAVVSDNNLSDVSQRNVIFHFRQGEENFLQLIGINLNVVLKKLINPDGVSIGFDGTEQFKDGGDLYWQINCKELTNFLGAYKSLRKTRVSEVIFESIEDALKIKCTVVEVDKNKDEMADYIRQMSDDDERQQPKEYTSQWVFKNIEMKAVVLDRIIRANEKPEGVKVEQLSCVSVLWCTSMVLPIMQNITSLLGNVCFDSEHIVGFSNAFIVFIKNNMSCNGIFEDIKMGYSTISFLNKFCSLCTSEDMMEVYRTDSYICIKMGNSEVFLVYDTRMANYKMYIEMFKKEHVITFDRIYLKDMLKRFSLVDDNIEFKLDLAENRLMLSNSKFRQDLGINYQRGMEELDKLKFRILPEILNKAILGVDETMLSMASGGANSDIYMYFCGQNKGNYNFVLSDGTGLWFTFVNSRMN